MKKLKLTRGKIISVIVAAVIALIMLSLIITNIFIPVKYLSSYAVKTTRPESGVMRVGFVDAGYGDCTVVEFPDGRNMVIDGGSGSYTSNSNILKYLNRCGIDTIDMLVCTSVRAQFCGGLSEILRYKSVKKVYMPYCNNIYVTEEYKSFSNAAKNSGAEIKINEYGAGEGSVKSGLFKMLSPSVHTNPYGEYTAFNKEKTSANIAGISAVIWLEYAGTSFLLTSGANEKILSKLCADYAVAGDDYPARLSQCTVLKAADFGNKNSACAVLYDLIKPKNVVLSVGENGYGCPSANALSNALNYAQNFYRTDEHGTVVFEVTSNGINSYGEKQ